MLVCSCLALVLLLSRLLVVSRLKGGGAAAERGLVHQQEFERALGSDRRARGSVLLVLVKQEESAPRAVPQLHPHVPSPRRALRCLEEEEERRSREEK